MLGGGDDDGGIVGGKPLGQEICNDARQRRVVVVELDGVKMSGFRS
jgi:hypothetical protein